MVTSNNNKHFVHNKRPFYDICKLNCWLEKGKIVRRRFIEFVIFFSARNVHGLYPCYQFRYDLNPIFAIEDKRIEASINFVLLWQINHISSIASYYYGTPYGGQTSNHKNTKINKIAFGIKSFWTGHSFLSYDSSDFNAIIRRTKYNNDSESVMVAEI